MNLLKKRKAQKNILYTLFFPYMILFIITFFILAVFFVSNESKKIKNTSMTSIVNNVNSISDSLDVTINGLDMVSQNIIYSNLIKEHFMIHLNNKENMDDSSIQMQNWHNLKNNQALYDLLTALIGSRVPVDQVNLYSLNGVVFSAGLNNSTKSENVSTKKWYQTVTDLSGKKYVFLDKNVDLKRFFSYSGGEYFLSLSRMYYSTLNSPQGIVEVEKSFVGILDIINAINYTYKEKVYLYDSDGKMIYPQSDTKEAPDYIHILQDKTLPATKTDSVSYKYIKSTRQHLLYQHSSYSKFTTLIVVENIELMKPLYRYLATIFLILLFVCAATIILSFIIARRICAPLNKMHLQLRTFQLTGDIKQSDLEKIETNVTELNTLYQAFIKMKEKAKIAMENELLLQSREMQSRMLALHAQMNPHFLYNSLSTIQAMADEDMNEEIILMCQNISRMLRYISANEDQLVNLSEEVSHTKDYMECMKIRYFNELSFSISIPDEMLSCKIPKLCLQLIVENAIKFTTTTKAPWYIHISGSISTSHWELQIRDNGPGFSKEKLEELYQRVAEVNKTGTLPNLEINGMGLLNIYMRFKILYKGNHIFRFSNHAEKGAIVTIGSSSND